MGIWDWLKGTTSSGVVTETTVPTLPEVVKKVEIPPEPVEKPLAEASRRLKGLPPKAIDPKIALGMSAAGVPQSKIAAVMGGSHQRVSTAIESIPGGRELVQEYRDKLKSLKIVRAHRVENRLWDRLESEVEAGEAKSVDAMMRAIHASEKVQASVSGEGQKVTVEGTAPVDLKILLQQLNIE